MSVVEGSTIRRKASQRKRRNEDLGVKARRPTQKRSLDRFNIVLEATEQLLQTANIEDISFYDIARVAKLPPASVHYLFPTMASVRIELSRLYNERMSDLIKQWGCELSATVAPRWQDRVRAMAERTREHFNAHRAICEVLFGPVLHRESRLANSEANDAIAATALEEMQRVYVMPDVPDLVEHLTTNCEIVDALWSRSYLRHGAITAEALEEVVRVQIACLRLYLPEIIPLRDPTAAR
jgi:AcrR family transcriptional regulator